ncbi:MAG: MFS transporter [Myxococcota bacterium]
MAERTVKLRNLLAYGVGDIFGGGSFFLIGLLFLFFLTEVVGLSPLMASLLFGVGKIWDAVADPIMGHISDHTRSRYGRRRVFFLLGIVPIAVSFFVLWIPIHADSEWLVAGYYCLTYIFFNTVYTMVMVPYSALNAEMSTDYRVRTRLTAARITFSILSAAVAGTLAPAIRDGAATLEQGFLWISIIFALLYAVPWIVVFLGTWEGPVKQVPPRRFRLLQVARDSLSLLRNRSFRVHLLMYICAYTAVDGLVALFPYYVEWILARPVTSLAMGSLMVMQILTLPIYAMVANKAGKGVAYRIGLLIFGVGVALAATCGEDTPVPTIMAVCALIGCGLSAAIMMPFAILPSVIDVDEAITGEVRSGAYSGAMTLIRKFVQGLIVIPTLGLALTAIGYVENTGAAERTQAPETIANLKILFFTLPMIFIVLGFVVSLYFRITPRTHAILVGELERLRGGGDRDAAEPEARGVLEQLTGLPYAELYPEPSDERPSPANPARASRDRNQENR